jgi:hypothetical protein
MALILSVIRRLPNSLSYMEESMAGYVGVNGIFFIIFICAYNVWVISPPFPHPFHYHPTPSLCSPPPPYQAEAILPLSLILLKREYKQ